MHVEVHKRQASDRSRGHGGLVVGGMLGAGLGLFLVEAISLHSVDAVMYAQAGPVLLIGWIWAALGLVIAAAGWRRQFSVRG